MALSPSSLLAQLPNCPYTRPPPVFQRESARPWLSHSCKQRQYWGKGRPQLPETSSGRSRRLPGERHFSSAPAIPGTKAMTLCDINHARPYTVYLLTVASLYVCEEFARRPQPLHDLGAWKATEYHQFLLYTGPVLLVFGHEEDVRLFGPLNNFRAFRAENFMGQIRRLIRLGKHQLQQLHRRVHKKIAAKSMSQSGEITHETDIRLISHPHKGVPLPRDCAGTQYSVAQIEGGVLKTRVKRLASLGGGTTGQAVLVQLDGLTNQLAAAFSFKGQKT
ncbi:hypothetical protein HPB52_000916 [Rhipicephalus sanguineus]|uniref:Uncharacterized protein n=1 Tax=Rhipicephalus sanguineus TaxID=34632 RepID=A0A9D4PTT5_RHISA|nr:hypothetical protein HPB52_000916 [Rhipicephalus sanguineus]